MNYSRINSMLIAFATFGSAALVAGDANATNIPDNLFIQGNCAPFCAGQIVIGHGQHARSLWLTDTPLVNGKLPPNLQFGPNFTKVVAPGTGGHVAIAASNLAGGVANILTANYDHSNQVGRVGINNDSPAFPLDVQGRIKLRSPVSLTAGIWLSDSNGANDHFIGTKTHSSVVANQEVGFWFNNFGWLFAFKGDGQAFKPGGGSWAALSDSRVKKDVTTFEPGLAEVEKVRPVKFQYNGLGGTSADGKQYVGVIAQELEPVAPYMVSESAKKLREADSSPSEVKQVDPSAFTYMLINAVKELAQQNRELKAAVCDLNPKARVCSSKPSTRFKDGAAVALAR